MKLCLLALRMVTKLVQTRYRFESLNVQAYSVVQVERASLKTSLKTCFLCSNTMSCLLICNPVLCYKYNPAFIPTSICLGLSPLRETISSIFITAFTNVSYSDKHVFSLEWAEKDTNQQIKTIKNNIVTSRTVVKCILNFNSRPLFLCFRLFNAVDSK